MTSNNEKILKIITLSKIIEKVSKTMLEFESPLVHELFSKPEYKKSGLITIYNDWKNFIKLNFPNPESIEVRINDYTNAILVEGLLSDALYSLKHIDKISNSNLVSHSISELLNGSKKDISYLQILNDILNDTINDLTALNNTVEIEP